MTDSVINRVVAGPPAPGHRISFIRLGSLRTLDLTELYEQSGQVAAYLRSLGIESGDRIGILAANSLEWVLLDLAALRLKAVVAGFEPGKFADAGELVATLRAHGCCSPTEPCRRTRRRLSGPSPMSPRPRGRHGRSRPAPSCTSPRR